MSIIDKLRALHLNARKTKMHIGFYTNLLSEVVAIGKSKNNETSEDEALAVIKSNARRLRESSEKVQSKINSGEVTITPDIKNFFDENTIQIKLLEDLMPAKQNQLSEEGLKSLLNDTCKEMKKSEFMRYLKENYVGRYDGALASKVFDSVINE